MVCTYVKVYSVLYNDSLIFIVMQPFEITVYGLTGHLLEMEV